MKIWIAGYIGSGKTSLAKTIGNVFSFDEIEMLLTKKGYQPKLLNNRQFKEVVAMEIRKLKEPIIEGIQCCDYYQKGDKVYFVKTNIFQSLKRCYQRDGKKKILRHLFDNFILFYRFKILYIKAFINKDLISDINT